MSKLIFRFAAESITRVVREEFSNLTEDASDDDMTIITQGVVHALAAEIGYNLTLGGAPAHIINNIFSSIQQGIEAAEEEHAQNCTQSDCGFHDTVKGLKEGLVGLNQNIPPSKPDSLLN